MSVFYRNSIGVLCLHICVAASGPNKSKSDIDLSQRIGVRLPRNENIGVNWPTRQAKPIELQPPALVNSVKTVSVGVRGAITHSGIITAKNPNI